MKKISKIKMMLIKRQANKIGFPVLKVANRVLERYREIVNNNEDKSDNEIILKLSRNHHAGEIIEEDRKYITVAYGCLHIKYDLINKEIFNICNYRSYSDIKKGNIDFRVKHKLNNIYGLKESK